MCDRTTEGIFGVLTFIVLALAGGVLAGLIALLILDGMGNTYRSGRHDVRQQLRTATLYHYCAATFVDQFVDPSTGTVTLRRRSRTTEPYLTGRRAIYFYATHGSRGAKNNHPKHWRSEAAVITVQGTDLLAAIGDAGLKYRRYDSAVAVLADYHGPGQIAVRSGDIMQIKNNPTSPGYTPPKGSTDA